jgi:tetratricopeptide (TPR) repeat protein
MKRFYMPIILSVWSLVTLLVAGCVVKDKPSLDAEFYFNRGLIYHEKGQYDQAITKYTKAIETNPKFAPRR